MSPAEDFALSFLKEATEMRREAIKQYKAAIKLAHKTGISNVKIAAVVGVSETAIRMYRKRNKL